MTPAQRDALITALLLSPRMQSLWDVRDRGMPVYAHTLDVALLCLDRLPPVSDLDTTAIMLGALVHDYSKLPLERLDGRSHSFPIDDRVQKSAPLTDTKKRTSLQ